MDFFKRLTKDNKQQSSFDADITKLQEQLNTSINKKDFLVDKILLLLKEIKNLSDLQKAVNKEVTQKLPPEEIIKWKPIKFSFLTNKNIMKILTIMTESNQKLNDNQNKMMYPNIKKILLKNNNDATNLIKYIKKEQIMYFDNELLEQIPIDNIKKFTLEQIDCLNPEQFEILLNRKDCFEYICNNGFRKLPAHQASIISKLPYRKITELTEDEINSLHIESVKTILKWSYDVSKTSQTSKQFNAPFNDKELTEEEKDLRQNLRKTALTELHNFQETLQTSDKFRQLRSLIPGIINIELQKIKKQNATPQQITENLDYLIYHIGQEQIKYLDNYVLTNLPKELILKFSLQQVKNFSSAQCLTLLKREDCSDYVINNLTAEQIYDMDLKNILTLPSDTIKKFVTKHQKFLFVNNDDDYFNNLKLDYRDKNNPKSIATQYFNEYTEKCRQFNNFRKNIMLLIESLLDQTDFTDFVLPMLQSYHFSKLSKKTLKKLIDNDKLDLQKQNISIGTLKKWFEEQIHLYPSQLIDNEWVCDRLQNLTDENYQLAAKLIKQIQNNEKYINKTAIHPYEITYVKEIIISQIQDLNQNILISKENEQNKVKLEKLIDEKKLKAAGKEIAENLSNDTIKLLTTEQISLIIKCKILKYFPEDRVDCFSTEKILKLDLSSIENLVSLAIEIKETKPRYQKTIDKFFDTYISCFSSEQLKSLFKNGSNLLLPNAIQKIKPEILFSDNEDDKQNILWKINVMNLDFSKFKEPFYKNNFLTVDVCKKFSSEQIEQLLKSEKIKYLSPEFLVGLSEEQIGFFNTESLTEYQISILMEQNKFKYLNSKIIQNDNLTDCLKRISSCDVFSLVQQAELIKSDNFRSLNANVLRGFNSNLIVTKFNYKKTIVKGMASEQNLALIDNLVKNNKIKDLNPDVIETFTIEQIKQLGQHFKENKSFGLTNKQIEILVNNNQIRYLGNEFVASKLTEEQVKNISIIIKENQHMSPVSKDKSKLSITIGQFIALSNTDKFCYIPISKLNFYYGLESQLQNLNLENATAEQINALFENNDLTLSEKQIEQILRHQELAKIDSAIIKKIGTNITQQQLQNLNLENMSSEQLEVFWTGCKDNSKLENIGTNDFFKETENDNKIDILVRVKSFQRFYLNKKYNVQTLDEIILQDTKSNFANDKLFSRMVQNKLSMPENQNDNSKTNNGNTQIQPQMKKSYKKFIKSLSNEEIKNFCLNQATQNFVDYLPIKKLVNLNITYNNLSKSIQQKLIKEKERIEWWVNFWNHVPLIGRIYQNSKQSLLNNIKQKLPLNIESYELNPSLKKTQIKINNVEYTTDKNTNEYNNGKTIHGVNKHEKQTI